jgi:hypothetical protein
MTRIIPKLRPDLMQMGSSLSRSLIDQCLGLAVIQAHRYSATDQMPQFICQRDQPAEYWVRSNKESE